MAAVTSCKRHLQQLSEGFKCFWPYFVEFWPQRSCEGAQENNKFKQDRQNVTLNRWSEKKCMANSCKKCLRQLVKLRPGIGLRLGDLKVETEALVFAAQEKALGTNYIQFNIDKLVESPL